MIGIKINIGCGDGWRHEGWVGLDYDGVAPYFNNDGKRGFDVNWDLRRGLPFRDKSVKIIFASHVLEHFTYLESGRILKECHRVLEQSGYIRIVVPDLDLYLGNFLARDESFFRDARIAGGQWRGNIVDSFLMNFYSDPSYNGTCHKYAYNLENLRFRLESCGFSRVTKSGYMKSAIAELNSDAFDSQNKVPLFSLYVEAMK
jgi:SAM-dependent methyltransferase